MKCLEIRRVEQWDALYRRYPGRPQPQPCYIELNCAFGVMQAEYDARITAVPMSVWHGHIRRYGIPCLTADAANELMDEIAPLAQQVLDGYESEWDGSNLIAAFDEDAQQAEERIAQIIDNLLVDDTNTVSGVHAAEE
jgi:hypothetical protein